MNNLIEQFNDVKNQIFKAFNCPASYFLKCAENAKWTVSTDNDMNFLYYGSDKKHLSSCVIISRENKPMIYNYKSYTMIIVIECVKTAVILDNANKIS